MPQPKYRTSSSKRDMRRSHDFLTAPGMSVCQSCGEVKRPHSVCQACGSHKGKVVIKPKASTAWNGEDFSAE